MTRPSVGASIPATSRNSVDFPVPLGPRTRNTAPSGTSMSTPRNTQGPPSP